MRIEKILSTLVLLVAVFVFGRYMYRALQANDTVGPNIEMDETLIEVSVEDLKVKLLSGMTATDAKDGDVTDSLVVENISEFIEENTRTVTYAAFDRDNNVTKTSRRMIYTDYVPAVFSLTKAMSFPVGTSQQTILNTVRVRDCIDGDLSDNINFSSTSVINVDTAGDYKVTMVVTNSAGDTFSIPLTVTIYESSVYNAAPKIKLTSYLVYTKVGEPIDPMDYLDSMTYRNTKYPLTEERGTFRVDTSAMTKDEIKAFKAEDPAVNIDLFEILDMTNYNYPGVYEIQYTLDDSDGNRGRVLLTVVVEE